MGSLFGTDGVRGIANVEPMSAEQVLEIGRAAAYVVKQSDPNKRHQILIGKDTRISGYMVENALTAGICSMGVDVLLVGPMPTPGIAFLTRSMRADAGMVISASHNPYQDNGIKIFSRDGYKLPDETEAEIERLVLSGEITGIRPTATDIGRAARIDDARGRYIVFCKNTFPEEHSLEGLRVVLDCGNGATYKVAPIIFNELGAEVIAIHNHPDGKNINDNCGSQHTQDLVAEVQKTRADIGLAFDGDGDRLIAVNEKGEELTGDHIIAICADHYNKTGQLKNNQVVTTIMSNFGFHQALGRMGINHLESKVGDRYVLEQMREHGAVLGGEQSGHLIFLNHHTTGDGIIAALQLLTVMRQSGEKLSTLSGVMSLAPQQLINVKVSQKPPLEDLPSLKDAVTEAEKQLDGQGRVLIRYSGTQSMCRVMVEGPDQETTDRMAGSLARSVEQAIG